MILDKKILCYRETTFSTIIFQDGFPNFINTQKKEKRKEKKRKAEKRRDPDLIPATEGGGEGGWGWDRKSVV